MENDPLLQKIQDEGYVAINIEDIYYYTAGMGTKKLDELFCPATIPFSAFQVLAQDYYNGTIKDLNEIHLMEEYKVPGFGMERAQIKFERIPGSTVDLLKKSLAAAANVSEIYGFLFVLTPDENNWHFNHPESKVRIDIPVYIGSLTTSINKDIEDQKNEAVKLLQSLGIKIP